MAQYYPSFYVSRPHNILSNVNKYRFIRPVLLPFPLPPSSPSLVSPISGFPVIMSPDSVTDIPLLGFDDGLWDSPEFMSLVLDQPVNRIAGEVGKCSRTDAVDDRKRRRMISNRESARRSRMRKQQHLDGLRAQVNRLRFENGKLENRIGLARKDLDAVRQENDQLRQEAAGLWWMLRQSCRILQLQLMAALNTQNHSLPAIVT